jgi:DNA-binding beta-propeller fold protein YncE
VYVANRGAHPVVVLDRNGNLLTTWGKGLFSTRAHGIYAGPDDTIYCTDDGSHTMYKFSPGGKLLLTLGKKDQPSDTGYTQPPGSRLTDSLSTIKRAGPPFNHPTGVALSSSGDIYVSDGYGNARVHKFSPDGTLLFSWGEPGYGPGQFRLPHSVLVDKHDRLWVTDRENNRIQIFDANGKFLNQWTDLTRPSDIFIDDEETVYVSELATRRCVSIFTIDGKLLTRWGSEGQDKETALFLAPHTIELDSEGNIYVGEVFTPATDRPRTIKKFARIR